MTDYGPALDAYQRYLAAGATGGNRREVLRIVESLKSVTSTFLEVTVSNGPADVFLDTRGGKPFCVANPTCKRGVVPGNYLVRIDRQGFKPITERTFIPANQVTTITKTLAEKPSPLVVRASPPDAAVEVDGAPAAKEIAPGDHAVTVRKEGYVPQRQSVKAADGKPIELVVELLPGVPVTVTPPDAKLFVDGEETAAQGGYLAVRQGAHEVTARAPGFREARATVPAERIGYRLQLTLEPTGAVLAAVRGAPAGSALLVDGQPRGVLPLAEPLELAPGDHTIEVRADGYLPFRKSATLAERQRATVELGDLRKPQKTKAWIAVGVAGAGLAAGSIFGVLALNKRTQYDDLAAQRGVVTDGMNIDPELDSLRSAGKRNSLLSDIGFGVGLVAAGAAIYWFATEGKGLSDGEIVVTPMGVAGRF
jgi:hypothetical protein